VTFARHFYSQVLTGLIPPEPNKESEEANDNELSQPPKPTTLSDALSKARIVIQHQGSTWGAYQHYGQANGRLIAPLQLTEIERATPRKQSAVRGTRKRRR
jgi:hypothetical protein